MNNEKSLNLRKICLWAGICLFLGSIAVLLAWQINIHNAQEKAERYLGVIQKAIPNPQGGVLEERRDNTMATMCIDGVDFVGVLEFPAYDSVLPVLANWGESPSLPCRFSGSVYDGSLKIGGSGQKGQLDFYQEISVGDRFFFTDMEGNRYSYEVENINYEKHADQTAFAREEGDLVLFVKNFYSFEYLVIFCNGLQ